MSKGISCSTGGVKYRCHTEATDRFQKISQVQNVSKPAPKCVEVGPKCVKVEPKCVEIGPKCVEVGLKSHKSVKMSGSGHWTIPKYNTCCHIKLSWCP